MEPLPRGANFRRAKTLWEIGLHIAGNPATAYGGNRDMCIVVGTGSGESFKPWLRMATGSITIAHAVARGEIEMAFVNPSGALTQAYRGKGLFSEPLPLRVVMSYPSLDHFVCAANPRAGLSSLSEVKERRLPLRLSIREDPTHSTRLLIDQLLACYGFTVDDVLSWGGSLQLNGPPADPRRMAAIRAGEVDLVLDEGIPLWFDEALAQGMDPLPFDEPVLQQMEAIGWRRVTITADRFRHLRTDSTCLDFSGWPLYTRASLPDEVAYQACEALNARAFEVPWEESYTGIGQTGQDTDATPIDVPLHPGAERWYREHREP